MSMMRRRLLDDTVQKTAEGEDIVVRSVARMRPGLTIYGKSWQQTTTGVQLLQLKPECLINREGLISTINPDGSMSVTGTPINQFSRAYSEKLKLTPGKYYVYGGDIHVAGAVNSQIIITRHDESIEYYLDSSFEAKADDLELIFSIQTRDEHLSPVNYTIYPMLSAGDEKKPFEPYTGGKPSPSLDYPQEIVSVGNDGEIHIAVNGKNLANGRLYHSSYSSGVPYIASNEEVVLPYTPEVQSMGIAYVVPCVKDHSYVFSVTNPNEHYSVGMAECESMEKAYRKDNALTYVPLGNSNKTAKLAAKTNGIVVCTLAGVWTDGTEFVHTCTDTEPLQVEIAEKETEYEKPKETQKLDIFMPNGLLGIPVASGGNYTDERGQQWVCDEVDFKRRVYIERKYKKHYSPSEIVFDAGGTPYNIYTYIENDKNIIRDDGPVMLEVGKYISDYSQNNSYRSVIAGMRGRVDENESQEDISKIFPNGIDVLFLRITPVESPLSDYEIDAYDVLHTNYPTTTVLNEEDAGMKLTYKTRKSLEVTN